MHASSSEKLFCLLRNHSNTQPASTGKLAFEGAEYYSDNVHSEWAERLGTSSGEGWRGACSFSLTTPKHRHIAWPGQLSFGRHHNIRSWTNSLFSYKALGLDTILPEHLKYAWWCDSLISLLNASKSLNLPSMAYCQIKKERSHRPL